PSKALSCAKPRAWPKPTRSRGCSWKNCKKGDLQSTLARNGLPCACGYYTHTHRHTAPTAKWHEMACIARASFTHTRRHMPLPAKRIGKLTPHPIQRHALIIAYKPRRLEVFPAFGRGHG